MRLSRICPVEDSGINTISCNPQRVKCFPSVHDVRCHSGSTRWLPHVAEQILFRLFVFCFSRQTQLNIFIESDESESSGRKFEVQVTIRTPKLRVWESELQPGVVAQRGSLLLIIITTHSTGLRSLSLILASNVVYCRIWGNLGEPTVCFGSAIIILRPCLTVGPEQFVLGNLQ